MSPDVIAAGVFGIAGAVVGAVVGALVGLFGERRVRARGDVECLIGDDDWYAQRSAYSDEHKRDIVLERRLNVLLQNGKDLPVTVLDMRVVFYKDGKPLGDEEQPSHVRFVDAPGQKSDISPLTLPPHVPVRRTLSVEPNSPAEQWALDASDRAEFVAVLLGIGTKNITRELAPWRQLPR